MCEEEYPICGHSVMEEQKASAAVIGKTINF